MRNKVALGELCNPSVGQVKENADTMIDYIDISSVDNESKSVIGFQTMAFSEAPSRARKDIKKNNILVSTVRPNLNAVAVYEHETPNKAVVSTGFCVLDCKENVDYRFVFNYCRSKTFIEDMVSQATGASYPAVSDKIVRASLVPEYSYEEQCEISHILDSVSSIIENRKKELEKLDDLIKARFVEMFGTLEKPVKEFNRATLKELCDKITDGKHGGCTQEEGTERYFVGAREIYDDEVHYDTAPEINVKEFEKDYKRCNIEIGDFLIVNTGATIGKSAIATDLRTEHTLLQKSVALLKVKRDLLNPVFLKWCYRVNTKMYMVESASAQPNLLLSKINATEIYVPDIVMQKQFADFVHQVDKSKVAVQKSLEETQLLFDSLMQKYFG